MGACDGRFFLGSVAAWDGFGLSPPKPKRRGKECRNPRFVTSFMVSPLILQPATRPKFTVIRVVEG